MDVSVIIVNYNTLDLISNCIESIISLTKGVSYEIIVVDNCSQDGSEDILRRMYGNRINYIHLYQNIGFGRANNEGIKIARGRNILFLNPDTILINNAIKILSDFLDKNDEVGACGGNLYDLNMNPTHSFRRYFPGIISEINDLLHLLPEKLFVRDREFNYRHRILNVAYITGADLMVKRQVLDRVGLFDPRFFMYYEDTELCYRISLIRKKIASLAEAKIQHLEGKSITVSVNRSILGYRSKRIYFLLTHSKTYTKIVMIIVRLNLLTRIFSFRFIDKKKYSDFLKIYKAVFS